jgi:FAD/FMN-containing dehydrogenase
MTNQDRATIDTKALAELKLSLRGPLLVKGELGYDDSRTVWNGMFDRYPAAVVRCAGVADIVTCVRFAAKHGATLSIKGGGHNVAGLATSDGGLLLDLSGMRGVWVDPKARLARAQAGCLLGDVDRETQLHGLAAVLGFVSNTGIAGLTLGGGFGYLTRRHGWTSDNVTAMDVVTAAGELVRASESENADLFWALRGGGGNFGVVTSFEYRLFPVGPEIVAGAIAWPAQDAPQVLERFAELTNDGPPELACIAALRIAPPAPWIDKDAHGKPMVGLFVCHTGGIEAAERDVQRITSLGKPIGNVIMRRSYVSQQALIDATQPKGRRYYWKSEYLKAVSPELLTAAIEHSRTIPSPHSALLMFPLAGALGRLAGDHSAVGNRDASAILNVASAWDAPQDDQTNIEWTRSTWRGLQRFSTGGVYVNFLAEDDGIDRLRAAYGKNYDRLATAKAKWDPQNLFRTNQNIVPSKGA